MAHPQIAVFARLADGNAQTVRRIEGQNTMLSRTTHTIAYDEIHDELIVPSPFAHAILTFPGGADGEEAPIRIIQGPKTELVRADKNYVDPLHNEIFVPTQDLEGHGMIHVFDRTAQGDVAPIRKLGGPDSGITGPAAAYLTVDYEHDLILVPGRGGLQIYNRTDSGNVEPLRIITGGPKSGTTAPFRPQWIPGTRNFLAAARPFGVETAGDLPGAPDNYQTAEEAQTFVGVWSIDDSGDVAPHYTIAHNLLKEVRNFAVNPTHKEFMVSDKTANAIYTFSFPEAWEYFAPVQATAEVSFDLESRRVAFRAPVVPPARALTPLYVKTLVQAAWMISWRARKSVMTRW